MINKEEAKIEAWMAIADLFGKDYFRRHFEGSCQAYPPETEDDVLYEYFLGFEDSHKQRVLSVLRPLEFTLIFQL